MSKTKKRRDTFEERKIHDCSNKKKKNRQQSKKFMKELFMSDKFYGKQEEDYDDIR